jgi:hypothetical protein
MIAKPNQIEPVSIDPTRLYPLKSAMAILGLRSAAFRKLKAKGLRIHRAGNNGYVLGRSIIAAITGADDPSDPSV